MVFASGDYLPWVVGQLRIADIDTSRMQTSGVPVLRSHNGDSIVGRVLGVRQTEDLWRSDWELPNIPANATTFDQLDSGLLHGVSVGVGII